ncbi:hypothetical protein BDF21DRAFT_406072 [Thamnidium elegans]|uniref:WIBG Mago-binding domain-containing protein n=1 Tax=Thamnidium elegans TaxID=101142 RepID=A0A8H7W0G2_9FUNG|nr:hypothetical protein INT48_005753 [Thamnidium elegans]KAI8095514.1 hypothetical protein BDF21DRAFT_406072 [Thamnidium elegans]
MSEATNAGIITIGEERWIPGSLRADGTYRKERKVRPGFVPQEDVKRYSNARLESTTSNGGKPGIPGIKKKEGPKPVKKDIPPPTLPSSDQTVEKKIKALNKKIRQITELEQRAIKGETLNEEQREKIKKGKSLREELTKLSL